MNNQFLIKALRFELKNMLSSKYKYPFQAALARMRIIVLFRNFSFSRKSIQLRTYKGNFEGIFNFEGLEARK